MSKMRILVLRLPDYYIGL